MGVHGDCSGGRRQDCARFGGRDQPSPRLRPAGKIAPLPKHGFGLRFRGASGLWLAFRLQKRGQATPPYLRVAPVFDRRFRQSETGATWRSGSTGDQDTKRLSGSNPTDDAMTGFVGARSCRALQERAQPLDRPFRQAQGPEPVEGLGALTHSTPLRVILSLSNG